LKKLTLNYNLLKSIHGLKSLRKLETLSLVGNMITDCAPSDCTEPMLELKELDLRGNKITCVEAIRSFPNLEEINLNDNPIKMIFPKAFGPCTKLINLSLDNVKLRWPKEDLVFLK